MVATEVPAALLLLADGRLPTGGHAHSGGLEEAVRRGAVGTPADLGAWLRGRLHTTGAVDAAFAAIAAHEAVARRAGRPDRWDDLAGELAARLPSEAVRRAGRAQGRGLMRAAVAAWPAAWLDRLRASDPNGPLWPLAVGAAGVAAGACAEGVAVVAASAAVTGPAWAATRLLGLDPFEVTRVLAALAPEVELVATGASTAAGPGWTGPGLAGGAAPLSDIGAERHRTWEVRLFAS